MNRCTETFHYIVHGQQTASISTNFKLENVHFYSLYYDQNISHIHRVFWVQVEAIVFELRNLFEIKISYEYIMICSEYKE